MFRWSRKPKAAYEFSESKEKINHLNQRLQQCVTSTVFKFVQRKCPANTNEVFRPAENMKINTRNSFLKLNHPFQKTSTRQKGLPYIGPAIWKRIPEIIRKTRNLNTFKHKMKQYYLNDLSNPNFWNVGRFDYALAITIIKNIFLFVKQIFLHSFCFLFCFVSFFLHYSDWRTTMKIRLFTCFVLSLPYCFSSL